MKKTFLKSLAGIAAVAFAVSCLSLIHISEPTRQAEISYAVFCLKKKKTHTKNIKQQNSKKS